MIAILLATAAPAAAPPAVPACPIERAVYRPRPAPEFTAGFARQDRRKIRASDLVFWLKTPKRTYWFSFGSPNGYGGTYIAPDIDPRAAAQMDDDEERAATARATTAMEPLALQFDAFEADLDAYDVPPHSEQPAPAYIFARGLGPALTYEWTGLAGGDPTSVQESMPIGMFELAGCGESP